jgi:hypothetical protein
MPSIKYPTFDEIIMNQAALAHLGERQTEVHFESRLSRDFWRYCVRSTEAAVYFVFLYGHTKVRKGVEVARRY